MPKPLFSGSWMTVPGGCIRVMPKPPLCARWHLPADRRGWNLPVQSHSPIRKKLRFSPADLCQSEKPQLLLYEVVNRPAGRTLTEAGKTSVIYAVSAVCAASA